MITNVEIGKLIRKMREDSGYTQAKLASLFNYDQSVISKMEKGQMGVTFELLVNCIREFGRQDIAILISKEIPFETIMSRCFTEEYKEKHSRIEKLPHKVGIEEINKNLTEHMDFFREIDIL